MDNTTNIVVTTGGAVITTDMATTNLATTVATTEATTNPVYFRGASQIGDSLGAMGQGMMGIFIVIAAIVGVCGLLNKFTSSKK